MCRLLNCKFIGINNPFHFGAYRALFHVFELAICGSRPSMGVVAHADICTAIIRASILPWRLHLTTTVPYSESARPL